MPIAVRKKALEHREKVKALLLADAEARHRQFLSEVKAFLTKTRFNYFNAAFQDLDEAVRRRETEMEP